MEEKYLWLTKMILAHLLTDFLLQPVKWIRERNEQHFAAPALYLHGLVTGAMAWILIGLQYWLVALVIFITHTAIDGWKSYQKKTSGIFLLDQAFHLLVIFTCWVVVFFPLPQLRSAAISLGENTGFWVMATGLLLLTSPTGILIGQLTKQWRNRIPDSESLANAGKWIGIIERIIIMLLVVKGEFGAIGLLIAAKSLLRFSEKGRALYEKSNAVEAKTEYLLIGSLLSLGIALITGIVVHSILYGKAF